MKDGNMNTGKIALIGAVGIGVMLLGGIASTYNSAISYEQTIIAAYKDNKNVLANYGLKIVEAAKVSDKYAKAFQDTVTSAIQGRYGPAGSQAGMQWLTEQNPTLDPATFNKLQQMVEAGRDKYENNQKLLIDTCRSYGTYRLSFFNQFMLSLLGFPKMQGVEVSSDGDSLTDGGLKLAKVCEPITSAKSEKAYDTGMDTPVEF